MLSKPETKPQILNQSSSKRRSEWDDPHQAQDLHRDNHVKIALTEGLAGFVSNQVTGLMNAQTGKGQGLGPHLERDYLKDAGIVVTRDTTY